MKLYIKPKVTVITICLNAEKYLEQTILSVINQDYSNTEYIIIDGKSKDRTIEIIKKYEGKIKIWVSETDSGIYDAMNKGIKFSTGDWINVMNAGDTFVSSQTVSLVMSSVNKNTDLITGDRYSVFENSILKRYEKAGLRNLKKYGMPSGHQSMFIRSKIMRKYLYSTSYRYASDHDLLIRLSLDKVKFQILRKPISCYLRGGISDKMKFNVYIEILFIFTKYFGEKFVLNTNHYEDFYNLFPPKETKHGLAFTQRLSKLLEQATIFSQKYNRVVLYGYGTVGKLVEKYFDSIIAVIDKELTNDQTNHTVCKHEDLKNMAFDAIIITALNREKSIVKVLSKFCPTHKIVTFDI
jgi:glycosyltransferase involved in cell wall biosynthesis